MDMVYTKTLKPKNYGRSKVVILVIMDMVYTYQKDERTAYAL